MTSLSSEMKRQIIYVAKSELIEKYMDYLRVESENNLTKVFYKDPQFECIFYFKNELLHNYGNPAVNIFSLLSRKRETLWFSLEEWYLNGKKFNPIGPSSRHTIYTDYDKIDRRGFSEYYTNEEGGYHRIDGPAFIEKYIGGDNSDGFYINDCYYQDEEDFRIMLRCIEFINKTRRSMIEKILKKNKKGIESLDIIKNLLSFI